MRTFIKLQITPVKIPTNTAINKDPVVLYADTANTPESASTEPCDRSSIPLIIKIVCPNARIVVTANCLEIFVKLFADKKFGFANEQTINNANRTI
jgi:hypothetical protein